MKKIRSKVIPLLCSLALVAPVYTLAQPASAAVVQDGSDTYFTDSNSGFFIELQDPQNINLTTNVINALNFRLKWYDDNNGSMDGATYVDNGVVVSYNGPDGDTPIIPDSSGVYTIKSLKTTGSNFSITIHVKNNSTVSTTSSSQDSVDNTDIYNGESGTIKIQLNYYNIDVPGSKYVTDFKGGSKLNAFNGKVSLQFPKNSFITDNTSTESIAPDQTVVFHVNQLPSQDGYKFISNSYTIDNSVSDSVYNSVSENVYAEPIVPGTITLSYTGDFSKEVALYNLSVVKYDLTNSAWVPIGGVVNSSSKTITTPISSFGTYSVAYNLKQYDINNNSWSKPFVLALANKGIIANDNSITSNLSNPISRPKFTVMIAKAMGWNPSTYQNEFTDINIDANSSSPSLTQDDRNYIQAAVDNGLVQGSGGNNFGTAPLTRQEAAVMISHAMKYRTDSYSNLDQTKKQLTRYYQNDLTQISDWAIPYVYAVTNSKIMAGTSPGYFGPQGTLTFEQACTVVYKIMDKLGKFGR